MWLRHNLLAKIFVLRPEGVQTYVEREKTEIENDRDLMEKFVGFQPYIINLSSFIVFELFINFSVIFGCAKMRQTLFKYNYQLPYLLRAT